MPVLWTDKARKAIALALKHARQQGDPEVTPAALLHGLLLLPRSVARDCLGHAQVDPDGLARALARPSPAAPSPGAPPVFSDAAETTLARAESLALRLGHEAVGTEVLLVAVIEQEDPTIGAALRACSIDSKSLHRSLASQLHPRPSRPRDGAGTKGASFQDAIERWEPEELIARVLAQYEREQQAAARREDYAAAQLYRERIQKLKRMCRRPPP